MDRQYGMTDFFTMEATEYLERLDGLVSAPDAPSGEELQRLTRALRGAALMANQQPIAATAGSFEHLARAVREGRQPWDEGTRQLAIRAVDDLKTFVRRARDWSDADTLRARELAATLERAGGRAPAPPRVSASLTADAGTRAFVAREGAALASTLARVAEAVRHNPAVTDPVQNLLQQMQPLRGLATLTEYPPLPDLLESIDRAAALAARSAGALPDPGGLLDSAARALTNATRDITTKGRADPDALEVRRFAGALRSALGLERPEVPIEALYAGGDDAPVVEPARAAPSLRLGQVELTSLGEHLKQIGVGVAAAGTLAQRELRILALVDPLRTLETGVPDEMQEPVHAFARAARDAIAQNTVLEHAESLGHAVQEAGVAIAGMSPKRLALVTEQIARLLVPLEVPVAPEPEEEAAAAEAPAPAAAAPTPPAPAPAPRPTPVATPAPVVSADDLDRETPDLAGSILRYERLVAAHGWGTPSLAELVSGDGGVAAPAAPAAAAAPPAPTAAPPAATPVEDLVPIESLCYSGRAALERALGLRGRVRELIEAGAPVGVVEELLEEVFDLVRLGSADLA
jgi:chemotaxis protein histidine kinase CheA